MGLHFNINNGSVCKLNSLRGGPIKTPPPYFAACREKKLPLFVQNNLDDSAVAKGMDSNEIKRNPTIKERVRAGDLTIK
jgi:hypothetical protein